MKAKCIFIRAWGYDAAITAFSLAIKLEPENERLYLNRGRVFERMQEYNAAHADFGRAWELSGGLDRLLN